MKEGHHQWADTHGFPLSAHQLLCRSYAGEHETQHALRLIDAGRVAFPIERCAAVYCRRREFGTWTLSRQRCRAAVLALLALRRKSARVRRCVAREIMEAIARLVWRHRFVGFI